MMKNYSKPQMEINVLWQHDVLSASYIESFDKLSEDIGNWTKGV